ncbi:MAG: dephospho-CoA kinase [Gammaproteobacteria bacterium]
MFVVGLTGGIGSGKSTIAALFAKLGATVVDADVHSRNVVTPGSTALAAITAHFGRDVLQDNGELNRTRLRDIVFQEPQQRLWLEQLLHPLIADSLRQALSASQGSYCILESPLLLETSQRELVNRVLVVDVSREIQLQRALARDNSEAVVIQGIIDAQMDRQARLQQADDVINNEAEPAMLAGRVQQLHTQYLKLAAQHEAAH